MKECPFRIQRQRSHLEVAKTRLQHSKKSLLLCNLPERDTVSSDSTPPALDHQYGHSWASRMHFVSLRLGGAAQQSGYPERFVQCLGCNLGTHRSVPVRTEILVKPWANQPCLVPLPTRRSDRQSRWNMSTVLAAHRLGGLGWQQWPLR